MAKTAEDKQKVIQYIGVQYGGEEVGVIPHITAASLRQTPLQKLGKPFMAFGKMIEAIPEGKSAGEMFTSHHGQA